MTTERILTCPIPDNINPLSPNGFMLSVQKLPSLSYFCQQANIPNVTLGETTQGTPFIEVPVPGDKMTFDPLTVQFLVDSEMKNYKAIFNWMNGLGFPVEHAQYENYVQTEGGFGSDISKGYSDGVLQVLGNTNKHLLSVRFIDLFPVALESLVFNSTNQDVQYLIGNATFRYTYYEIE